MVEVFYKKMRKIGYGFLQEKEEDMVDERCC